MSNKYIAVRKFRVCGRLSDHDLERLYQELTIQDRNVNKHIHIDRERRRLIRELQFNHPAIGGRTREYQALEREREDRVEEVRSKYKQPLRVINAKIAAATNERAAGRGQGPDHVPEGKKKAVMPLVAERRRIEKAQRDEIQSVTGPYNEQLRAIAKDIRDAKSGASSEAVEMRKQMAPLREAIAATIAQRRQHHPRSPEYKQADNEVKALRRELDALKARISQHDIYAGVNAQIDELKRLACQDLTPAAAAKYGFRYGEAGHSGTKWWIKKNQDAAAQKRAKDMSPEADPPYRRFQPAYLEDRIREGTLCAGINQVKASSAGPVSSFCSAEKGRLYILRPPSDSAYDRSIPIRQRKELQKTDVWFRIGSVTVQHPETRKPVQQPEWLRLPDVIFHQEIPRQAIVTEALLRLENVGAMSHLYLVLTIEMEAPKPLAPKTTESVTIQRHTQVGEGVLVYAKMETSGGGVQPLYFSTDPRTLIRHWSGKSSGVRRDPQGVLRHFKNGQWSTSTRELTDMFTYCDGLAQTKRDWFGDVPKPGVMRSRLQTTVFEYIASTDDELLPKCLYEAKSANVFKWKSAARMQKLYYAWAQERVPGDTEAFEAMKEWADQDLHLYQWACSQAHRMANRRLDNFRKQALALCRTYKTIYIDDIDTSVRERGVTEEAATARTKWARRASFGQFRMVLTMIAQRCGTELVKVSFAQGAAATQAEAAE